MSACQITGTAEIKELDLIDGSRPSYETARRAYEVEP